MDGFSGRWVMANKTFDKKQTWKILATEHFCSNKCEYWRLIAVVYFVKKILNVLKNMIKLLRFYLWHINWKLIG